MSVYLAYHTADAGWARRIGARLNEAGIPVLDPNLEIHAGENWALQLGKALESADAMVVVVSPHSAKSEWIAHEIGYALGSRKFEGRVFPVVVGKSRADALPWSLEMLQQIDVTKHPGAGLDSLVAALSKSPKASRPAARVGRRARVR